MIFANLSQNQQKMFETARQFYNHDLRKYNHQQNLLREARIYIQFIISIAKQTHLFPELTEHKWILTLRENTAPPEEYMLDKTREQYNTLLKGFNAKRIHQWLNEWKALMLNCIKYKLSEIQRDLWLKNLTRLFKSISEFCYEQFRKDATDEDKSDLTQFWTVARELREKFEQQKREWTVKDSAFQAIFGNDENSENEKPSQKRWKRSGSHQDEKDLKKPATQCSGCELIDHKLWDCWYIFDDLKSEEKRLSAFWTCKIKKTLTDNKVLKKKVEKLHAEMKKKV